MEDFICKNCGANEFIYDGEYKICKYCNSKYKATSDKRISNANDISDDIYQLLEKCKKYPERAKKYANLILDIDPTNLEAEKYL